MGVLFFCWEKERLILFLGGKNHEKTYDKSTGITAGSNDANNNETAIVVDTKILKEADDKMLNTYSAIAVNDNAPFVDADGNAVADVYVNTAGADALIQWLMTEEALNMAGEYGVAEYGEYLFYVKVLLQFFVTMWFFHNHFYQ